MALTKDVPKRLDDETEPSPKRPRIADDSFKSNDPSVQHGKVLQEWLLKLADKDDLEAWKSFNDWLKSERVSQLKLTDVTLDDANELSGTIESCLTNSQSPNPEIKSLALNSTLLLLENEVIRHYFKHNLQNYLKLVARILETIDETELILRFLKNENLYHASYVAVEHFHKYFIDFVLTTLINVARKFKETEVVFREVSAVLQHCIFQSNIRNFRSYFEELFRSIGFESSTSNETHELPKQIIKYLRDSYKSDCPKLTFKLLLSAFCETFAKDFPVTYTFLIVIYDLIGFDLSNHFNTLKPCRVRKTLKFTKSVEILAQVLDVVTNCKVVLNSKARDVIFSDFIRITVSSVICLSESPDENVLKIINRAVALDPLIAEQLIGEILPYVMLSDHRSCPDEYEKLVLNVFEIFSKLNRMEDFISKMIHALKSKLESDRQVTTEKLFGFNGVVIGGQARVSENQIQNILPDALLDYFTRCITTMASWQTVKLFTIFQLYLKTAVDEDLLSDTKNPECVTYVEVLCTLTCQFLKSVRVAEHTVTNVEKFVESMEEFKDVLRKYGTALVAMEHNLTLMRMYLNMSYVWGELYVILSYYSTNNEVSFTKSLDSDYSACNITYLHSYLTTKQWCLISQRITNFGEEPCKQLMHKLFTQRLKSVQLFENNVNEEIIGSYVKSLTQSLDDCWQIAVQDPFVLNTIMPYMQNSDVINIADKLISKIIAGADVLKNTKVPDNPTLVNAMVYVLMLKINRVFKHKRKQDVSTCTYIFKILDEVRCLFGEVENEDATIRQNVVNIFHSLQKNTDQKNAGIKLNEEKITSYLEILKSLPILSLKSNNQIMLFIYLTAILSDSKLNASSGRKLKETLENILTGIIQNGALSFVTLDYRVLIKCVLQTFTDYTSAVRCVIEKLFKTEDDLKMMKGVVDYLLEDDLNCEKRLFCSGLILSGINKHRKARATLNVRDDIQECKVLLSNELIKTVTSQDNTITSNSLSLYTLLLKDSLTHHNNAENLEKLSSSLDRYVEVAVNDCGANGVNNKDRLGLFATVLFGKNKFRSIEDDFVLKVWSTCAEMEIADDDFEEYSKLIAVIFQHVSNDEFAKMMKELLQISIKILKGTDYDRFIKEANVWKSIICCNFNVTKVNICQETFESLLHEIIMTAHHKDGADAFYENVAGLIAHLIETVKFPLTAAILDLTFLSVDLLINKSSNFTESFSNCIKITEALLKFRSIYISDRLPSFLQQYRFLMAQLIARSNEDLQLGEKDVKMLSDCSHKLEKLTTQLLGHSKPLRRIAMYLIADILNQYEVVTIHPSIKMHINNCVYNLMSLCDQHAVSFLMRNLSTASTEIFKFLFNNYKKYYRFTGKV